jgi:putative endonuclease
VAARGFRLGRSTLVFIEVKRRDQVEQAIDAVTSRQRQRIVKAAEWFVRRRPEWIGSRMRFDVMLVTPGRLPVHLRDCWDTGPRA